MIIDDLHLLPVRNNNFVVPLPPPHDLPLPFAKRIRETAHRVTVVAKRRRYILAVVILCYVGLLVWNYVTPALGLMKVGGWWLAGGRQRFKNRTVWESEAEEPGSPLTPLGLKADRVYKLGSLNREEYLGELEDFIRQHFPPADSDEEDPESLLNAMRAFFTPQRKGGLPRIPAKLWQTAASKQEYAQRGESPLSFAYFHQGLNVTFHDNQMADDWVHWRFDLPGRERDKSIPLAWDTIASPPILRSDMWRYLVLAVEGGVYADIDVEALRPITEWGMNPAWDSSPPDRNWEPPALIVGVEADAGLREDWALWWPRPLQIAQWTMASTRGHPVLIDTLRRIVNLALLPPDNSKPLSVMERTGPGPFTDAVFRYLRIKWGLRWADLRNLHDDGWRRYDVENGLWGDTKVLSITGFSPGIGAMGSGDTTSSAAMARHGFAGSWRNQLGVGRN